MISLILLLIYMIYAGVSVGITPTLSETYYRVKHKWAFTITLWAVAFSLLPTWLKYSPENCQFLAFIACAALCFVGASPAFKQEMDHKIHMGGLTACIVALAAWCISVRLWYVPVICAGLGGICSIIWRKYWGYIMECSAFATAYISVYIVQHLT